MERFSCKTRILAGAGAVSALKEFGAKRLFLVTDPYFMENGGAMDLVRASGAACFEIFSEVQPDPSVELAARGTARMKAFCPDLIVALGGGSAMDCAKAIGFFSGGDYKLVAVPTTSGSGSEVTDFAILTHGEGKYPLVDEKLRPDAAILDSNLLTALPKKLIADGGFDVIAHALEARVAKNRGVISDCLATRAFCDAFRGLPGSFAGEQARRLTVHKAATLAGMAFSQAGLGLCHGMSHALGGRFHVPHGRLNAVLLPSVMGCNSAAVSGYAALARAAGFGGGADSVAMRNLKNGLIRLRRELQLPETLLQAGVEPGELKRAEGEIVRMALEDPCCKTNPEPVTEEMVRTVLREVSGGG